MRKLLSTLALAALMAGLAAGAQARETGWYIRGDVGYSVDGDLDLRQEFDDIDSIEKSSSDYVIEQSYSLENDWMAALGGGYAFENGFRLEGEVAYRTNDLEDVESSVDVDALSGMVNLFYDFNRDGGVQPYVGVGVGIANVEVESFDDSGLAWQGLAGLAFDLPGNWALDIGYRYFRVEDVDFDESYYLTEGEYTHQAVTVGLRYTFAAPPPPPPVAPTPPPPPPPPPVVACPTSEFVVYFEWDRSNLNQAALETIDAAVARARQCNPTGAIIIGHTDTSGPTRYNDGLSQRRASVVRDALVARGLNASTMRLEARGERDLARPTPDGVREPLNRRTAVTIAFQ
jgi:opacity protein-like surface antigen